MEQETLRVVTDKGTSLARIYAMGELTKGVKFLTTDLGCVTAQAKIIARGLIDQLQQEAIRPLEQLVSY